GGGDVVVVRVEEDDRLGQRLQVRGDDELVGDLDRLPGPGVADADYGGAHRADQVPPALDGVGGAADHDRQRALAGRGLPAGHGRVERAVPRRDEALGDLARGAGLDGAHFAVGGARREMLVHAAGAEGDPTDVRGVGDL